MNLVKTVDNKDGTQSFYFEMPFNRTGYFLDDEIYDELLLAAGSANVYNRYDPTYKTSVSYTSSDTPYTGAIKVPTDPHEQMQLARDITIVEPVVGTVIDIMGDLMGTKFDLECDDSEVKDFFEEFNKQVGMQDLVQRIAREYYLSGNVPIYRDLDKEGIPLKYTILNPLYTHVDSSLLFDTEVISIDVSSELKNLAEADDEVAKELKKQIPAFILKQLSNSKKTDKIILPPDRVSRICRKKQDYEKYAKPYLARVFEPVLFKQKLRLMDLSTIEGLINQLLVVTIGNEKMPATKKQLKTAAELFATPKKAFTIIWPNNIKVEIIPPQGLETLDQDKYKQVNEDIALGLGVPRVIIDGSGTNFSTAFVAVTAWLERIDRERYALKSWMEEQYKDIAKKVGLKTYPTVRFDKSRLRQETYIRQVLNPLYEKGLLSDDTAIEEAGFNYEDELTKKKRNWENKKYFSPPNLPYSGNNQGGAEPGEPHDYDKKENTPNPDPGGGPDPKKDTEPSQTASAELPIDSFVEEFYMLFDKYYEQMREEAKQVAENEELTVFEKTQHLALLYEAFLMTAYDETMPILEKVCRNSYALYSKDFDEQVFIGNIQYLQSWHRKSIDKLINDLAIMSANSVETEQMTIDEVFDKNHYRVGLFSSESILNSRRQGEVAAFQAKGVQQVRWDGIIDDSTCPVCLERIGKTFSIATVPNRPHIQCRCWLTPVE